jgi:hypothetical protein
MAYKKIDVSVTKTRLSLRAVAENVTPKRFSPRIAANVDELSMNQSLSKSVTILYRVGRCVFDSVNSASSLAVSPAG